MTPPLTANTLSLDDLFEQTADQVYGFLMARSGSPALAEDLTGESFSAASHRFAQGRGAEVSLPWLLTVARRRLIDHWRAESTRERAQARLRQNAVLDVTNDSIRETVVDEVLASLPTGTEPRSCCAT